VQDRRVPASLDALGEEVIVSTIAATTTRAGAVQRWLQRVCRFFGHRTDGILHVSRDQLRLPGQGVERSGVRPEQRPLRYVARSRRRTGAQLMRSRSLLLGALSVTMALPAAGCSDSVPTVPLGNGGSPAAWCALGTKGVTITMGVYALENSSPFPVKIQSFTLPTIVRLRQPEPFWYRSRIRRDTTS
jgi:hypothetical protein